MPHFCGAIFLITDRMSHLLYRVGTAGVFAAIGGVGVMWACDWKAVLEHVPWYGKRYSEAPPK